MLSDRPVTGQSPSPIPGSRQPPPLSLSLSLLRRVLRWFRIPWRQTQDEAPATITGMRLAQGHPFSPGWYLVVLSAENADFPGAPWLRITDHDGTARSVPLTPIRPETYCRVTYLGHPVRHIALGLPSRRDGDSVRVNLWRAGPAWLVLWLARYRFGWRGMIPGLFQAAIVLPTRPHTALGRWLINDGQANLLAENRYDEWVQTCDTPDPADLLRLKNRAEALPDKPLISVVMPVYNTRPDLLADAIESIREQVYETWELCIADDCSPDSAVRDLLTRYQALDPRIRIVFRDRNSHISEASNSALALARGPFVALFDHDDLLPPHALLAVAETILAHPDADLIYSDEDHIDEAGHRHTAYFKPDWNPALILGHNMISHLGVYRRSLVLSLGGFRTGFEGSQDYDLALRVIEQTSADRIIHIPRILYHWRDTVGSTAVDADAKPYAWEAGKRAIEEHLHRTGRSGTVGRACFSYYRVKWTAPPQPPLVTVLIPTRDGLDMLRVCIDGLINRTTYTHWDAIVIDNGSVDPATLAYLDDLQQDPRFRVLRIDAPFNYSDLNNQAAALAGGDLLCLLNNDIVVIEPDWLDEMVQQMNPDVAVVGAKLLYADGRIQHGGVILGLGGVAGHYHQALPGTHAGYFGRAELTQDLCAVTAACLLIRRSVFQDVGGLNTDLAVAFNDVDLCLKVRKAGWRILWTPFATLYHLESATRGDDLPPEKRARFDRECTWMRKRWADTLDFDPYHNPNLSLYSPYPEPALPSRIHAMWATEPCDDKEA